MDPRAVTFLRDLAREAPSAVTIRGDCMSPLLASGDEIRVRAKHVYLPGDVLIFRTRAGDLAAHRVLGWRPAGLITKGDHCVEHDAPVARGAIIGAADVHVRLADRVRALAQLARILVSRIVR
ncbi:MAG TPA: hypothetical protein VJZ00_10570 [Thermoanaerobaculia bacterium]|nr:hypothetical protein [Thermoanaerobaculia bacterium]